MNTTVEASAFKIHQQPSGLYYWAGKGQYQNYCSDGNFATEAEAVDDAIANFDEIDKANSSELEDEFGFES